LSKVNSNQAQADKLISESASLRDKVGDLKQKLGGAESDTKHWKAKYEEKSTQISELKEQISTLEKEKSDIDSYLTVTVNAWNQLLSFLKKGPTKRQIKTQLDELKNNTKTVPGMKYRL
jgi:chromosome segregation ATPase